VGLDNQAELGPLFLSVRSAGPIKEMTRA